ncbi:hypothetical protein [Sphingomonas sp. Leaf34]|uniref:hypothetical protein n=1 Tax=Sphingomonas sp. Leaf34 TaxID=1736216 RepID=UPI0012E2B2AF|nr:hypothetical protein [Sphingomonas sp. Leaf34]
MIPTPIQALRLQKYTEIIMNESLETLKDKLEQALELADGLGLKVVGAWISIAINALSIEGETA